MYNTYTTYYTEHIDGKNSKIRKKLSSRFLL